LKRRRGNRVGRVEIARNSQKGLGLATLATRLATWF
jgi:hypothetical protein